MKPIYVFFLSFIVLVACGDTKSSSAKYKQPSVGTINSLQVVTPNPLWKGAVGDQIRASFAAATPGLPQDEPLFSIRQMPLDVFSGFSKTSRLFLHLTIAEKDTIQIRKNPFAKPQTGVFITATSQERLIALIQKNTDKIIQDFKLSEIKERQRRTKKSKLRLDSLPSDFGLTLEIPSAYRIAKSEPNFYWIRKELKSGHTNIIIYQVPINTIPQDSTALQAIIKMRDEVAGTQLPVEDGDTLITDQAYPPYITQTSIDTKFAFETKGTWEIKNQWMAGPFINYAVRDTANNRHLILEGFTYAPSSSKRDLQLELESILKSVKIK